jgi:Tol biopolymer transport system component
MRTAATVSSDSERPELFPKEIWVANIDASNPVKIANPYPGCQSIGQVIWFENETKVLFSCGYEGPNSLFLAATDGSMFVPFNELVGMVTNEGFSGTAMSPNESWLAFTDSHGTLQVVAINGGQSFAIPFGLRPNWSQDSRRLYYLKGNDEMFGAIRGIWMYDLDSHTEIEILPLPVHSPDNQEIQIYAGAGTFAVSPEETALVFQSRGLWLATWSP